MCKNAELGITIDKIRSASQQLYGDKLMKIILYGSYARGDFTEESDMDIMIILNCNISEIRKFRSKTAEMASDISLDQGVFLSVLLKDKEHFENNKDFLPFYRNVTNEGVEIYG
ncbi:MAG: nucleotidyltransferase domain-containing protein [Eubacterium sp.]|nr:nucleotidyltransferase domain-containing protein [Eubacterium sp.]